MKIRRFIFGDKLQIKQGKFIEDNTGIYALVNIEMEDFVFTKFVKGAELIKWFSPNLEYEDEKLYDFFKLNKIKDYSLDLNTIIEVKEIDKFNGIHLLLDNFHFFFDFITYFYKPNSYNSVSLKLYRLQSAILRECYRKNNHPLIMEYKKIEEENIYTIKNPFNNDNIVYIKESNNYNLQVNDKVIYDKNYDTFLNYFSDIVNKISSLVSNKNEVSITSMFGYLVSHNHCGVNVLDVCDFAKFNLKKILPIPKTAIKKGKKIILDKESNDLFGVLLIGTQTIYTNVWSTENTYFLFDIETFEKLNIPLNSSYLNIKIKTSNKDFYFSQYQNNIGYINELEEFIPLLSNKYISLGVNPKINNLDLLSISFNNKEFSSEIYQLKSGNKLIGYCVNINGVKVGIRIDFIKKEKIKLNVEKYLEVKEICFALCCNKNTKEEIPFLLNKKMCKKLLNNYNS